MLHGHKAANQIKAVWFEIVFNENILDDPVFAMLGRGGNGGGGWFNPDKFRKALFLEIVQQNPSACPDLQSGALLWQLCDNRFHRIDIGDGCVIGFIVAIKIRLMIGLGQLFLRDGIFYIDQITGGALHKAVTHEFRVLARGIAEL